MNRYGLESVHLVSSGFRMPTLFLNVWIFYRYVIELLKENYKLIRFYGNRKCRLKPGLLQHASIFMSWINSVHVYTCGYTIQGCTVMFAVLAVRKNFLCSVYLRENHFEGLKMTYLARICHCLLYNVKLIFLHLYLWVIVFLKFAQRHTYNFLWIVCNNCVLINSLLPLLSIR